MFGLEDIPLVSHELLAAIQAIVDGQVEFGNGNPDGFVVQFATNGERGISEALVSRFHL